MLFDQTDAGTDFEVCIYFSLIYDGYFKEITDQTAGREKHLLKDLSVDSSGRFLSGMSPHYK